MFWVLAGSMLSAGTWDARFEGALRSTTYAQQEKNQLQTVLEQADEERVPIDMLLLKLEEGIAKNIPAQPLYAALDRELQGFTHTRQLVYQQLERIEAERLLSDSTIWSKIATLYHQGVPDSDLGALIGMFNKQQSKDKWNNFRYGGGLLIALRQWGLTDRLSLDVVQAISSSTILGEDYRKVLDLFNIGFAARISPASMAQRIIEAAPKSRSITTLERMVR